MKEDYNQYEYPTHFPTSDINTCFVTLYKKTERKFVQFLWSFDLKITSVRITPVRLLHSPRLSLARPWPWKSLERVMKARHKHQRMFAERKRIEKVRPNAKGFLEKQVFEFHPKTPENNRITEYYLLRDLIQVFTYVIYLFFKEMFLVVSLKFQF